MTTPNPFVRASSGEMFVPTKHPEWLGKLMIVRPNYVEYVTFKPEDGEKKVVNCFIAILDLPDATTGLPTVLNGTQIAGAGMVPQIENHIGECVLGRLIQGQPQPGKNPAWKLETNFTDADAALAGQYIAQFPLPPVPSAPAPAPAPQPVAAPPAAPWGQAPAQPQQAAPQGQFSPPPPDVWGGVNAAPAPVAQPAAPAWGQPPVAAQAPAYQPPAPAPVPPAAPAWGQPPVAAQPDLMAGAQQWGNANQPAPAVAQNPVLVAFLQSKGVDTAGMGDEQMTMIANSFPQ